ncbi:MAG TPA: hypothetical protein VGJ77_22885, partial [Gaiellaceae bacterium]
MAANASAPALARLTGRRPPVVSMLGLGLVGLILIWLAINAAKEPSDFLDLLVVGLTVGMVYALIALGYSLVYGILELINFAHGDVFMLGGMLTTSMVGWFALTAATHGKLLALIFPMLLIAA